MHWVRVGTWLTLKSSGLIGLIGTQILPTILEVRTRKNKQTLLVFLWKLTCFWMDTPWRFEQMIYACWYIGINARIKISENKSLKRKVFVPPGRKLWFSFSSLPLLLLHILNVLFILFLVNFPQLLTTCTSHIFPYCAYNFPWSLIWKVCEELFLVHLEAQQVVITDDDFLELFLEIRIHLLKAWVKRVAELHFTRHFISNSQIAVADHSLTHIILHFARSFVTYPCMDTSSTREDPE